MRGSWPENFNPRSHERSDQGTKASSTPASDISIHAPTRGATKPPYPITRHDTFQSTLPREERLQLYREDFERAIISIHAPTRGATNKRMPVSSYRLISIHAPTRGATIPLSNHSHGIIISIHAPTRGATRSDCRSSFQRQFQSTLPREERPDLIHHQKNSLQISIHAPTRGATDWGRTADPLPANFNPRSHERSDSNIAQKICLFLYNTDNKYIIR